jgi:hypothetical protein
MRESRKLLFQELGWSYNSRLYTCEKLSTAGAENATDNFLNNRI